jgi:hypothetical protein
MRATATINGQRVHCACSNVSSAFWVSPIGAPLKSDRFRRFSLLIVFFLSHSVSARAESIVNYVNQYAFAICAIYGKSFIPAAKEAWGLMRSRGFDAVINDSLIGGVLAFAQIVCGLLTGIVTALIAYYSFDTDWRAYAGLGFIVGVMLMTVVCEVVEAAVITLFICLADDPVTLQRTKPNEYNKLVRDTKTRTCGATVIRTAD